MWLNGFCKIISMIFLNLNILLQGNYHSFVRQQEFYNLLPVTYTFIPWMTTRKLIAK
jgi:hypothetical protein